MTKRLPKKYQNQVILGDVMETLKALPNGCVDMIFGDPDYGVGINYAGRTYAKAGDTRTKIDKRKEYKDWYQDLTIECMRVLSPSGNLFMMNYPRQNAYLRVLCLDEIAYDVQDYAWVYPTNVGHSPRRFTTAHRSILHATKSKENKFYKEQVVQAYKNPNDPRIRRRIEEGHKGRMPYSWFEFNLVKNVSRDKTVHACQVPLKLYDMLLQASTKQNDSVFVLFGGSGSEVLHTRNAKRTYLSCELHEGYCHMINDRLKQEKKENGGEVMPQYRLRNIIAEYRPEAVQQARAGVLAPGGEDD